MPKVIVSIDGVVIKVALLTQERTSLGRRPYNDIVIDNLAVSGEHAVLHMAGTQVHLEDLNSTNGTYVNGKAVKKQLLQNSDTVEIGKYKIKYVNEVADPDFEQTMMLKADPTSLAAPSAAIKVMTGAAAGREVQLVKVVTTIGKPGVAVAAITKRPHGFVVTHVDGVTRPSINGEPIQAEPVALKNGDMLELAGTQMQFVFH